jgi:hypothetical protein
VSHPNVELDFAYTAVLDQMAHLDGVFARHPGADKGLQGEVMLSLELILISTKSVEPEPPVRRRSRANGVPMTGLEVPLHD